MPSIAVPRALPAVASLADQPARELAAMREAEGQLWTLGPSSDAASGRSVDRRRIVLPTYPFERKRHWFRGRRACHSRSSCRTRHGEPAIPPSEPTSPANTMTVTAVPSAGRSSSGPRATPARRLRGRLRPRAGRRPAADSFVELGLDSLTLTQVALRLKKEFALNITFRQLMESYRSLMALAAHLDQVLPRGRAGSGGPVAAAAVAPVAAAMPVQAAPVAMACLCSRLRSRRRWCSN